MTTAMLDLDDDLATLLRATGQSLEDAALELIVMELYRRGTISRGRAAEHLGLPLRDFLERAGALGIPFADYTEEEWEGEMRAVDDIDRDHPSSPTPAR